MPIQTLCRSVDGKYLVGTSTSQETLQLIDGQLLKELINTKKKKTGKRPDNAFFADMESNGQEEAEENDDEDSDDDDDSDEEMSKPPKKKKKKRHV